MRKVVKHEYDSEWIKLLLPAEHSSLSVPCCFAGRKFLYKNGFCKKQTLRKPINYFVANMAISDLLYPIFLIPLKLTWLYVDAWLISGPVDQVLCKLRFFLSAVSSIVSVVMSARMANFLASDWFSLLLTGKATADRFWLLRGFAGSVTGNDVTGTGSDVTGTGSDVFWNGKPLTSWKNRSWAQGEAKPLRNAGSKSKVQFLQRGWSENTKIIINTLLSYFFHNKWEKKWVHDKYECSFEFLFCSYWMMSIPLSSFW